MTSDISSQPADGMEESGNPTQLDKPASKPAKPKRIRGDAIQRLRKASSRIVRNNSASIADTLLVLRSC